MEHELRMREALALAGRAAANGDVPVGCVITDESGTVIGTGFNRREADGSAVAHAEVEAITAACKAVGSWRLEGCTLYVTLEPCPMCAGALAAARVDRVVFGAFDARGGACGSMMRIQKYPLYFMPTFEGGVMERECSEILTAFFKQKR